MRPLYVFGARFLPAARPRGQFVAAATDSGIGIPGGTWHALSIEASSRTGLVLAFRRTALAAKGDTARQTHGNRLGRRVAFVQEPSLGR